MGVTLENIDGQLKTIAAQIESFQATVTKEMTGMNESIQFLVVNSVTHEELAETAEQIKAEIRVELKSELKKTKHEIMDYVDRKDREYRGELNLSIQKEDRKVDKTVDLLGDKKVFAAPEIVEIKLAGPFQAPAAL